MEKKAIFVSLVFLISFLGCETNWLNDNVKIQNISTRTPGKDHVIVVIALANSNNSKGKISLGAEVNCGTVTWRENKTTVVMSPNSGSIVEIEFKGVKDRIPTMAEKFEYQARIYNSASRVVGDSGKHTGTKPSGPPDK